MRSLKFLLATALPLCAISINAQEVIPKADLMDVEFAADGSATDVSPLAHTVQRKGVQNNYTYWNTTYQIWMGHFDNPLYGKSDEGFYRIDYTENSALYNALSQGHSIEVLTKPEGDFRTSGSDEAKPFASHQAGGTGIMVSSASRGGTWTFLPNANGSPSNSGWTWTESGIQPVKGEYVHLVGVYDKAARKSRIYVNGELKKEVDVTGEYKHSTQLWWCIGGDAGPTGEALWTGDIALPRVYSKALTDSEVKALYKVVKDKETAAEANALVTEVSFLASDEQTVVAGGFYKINGKGFLAGDKMEFVNPRDANTVVATCHVTPENDDSGATARLPEDFSDGHYAIYVRRGDLRQFLGFADVNITSDVEVMLEVGFNADGSAQDMSLLEANVARNGSEKVFTYWSPTYQRWVAHFENEAGASGSEGFYRIDYSEGSTLYKGLAESNSLEALVMCDFEPDVNTEYKPFSSMEAGGTGFLVCNASRGKNGTNEWTFLPNANNGWAWSTSGIKPEKGRFYHLVGVYDKDAKKARIYVDGVLCNEVDATSGFKYPASGCNWFAIGGDPGGNNAGQNLWKGDVAGVKIFAKALTDEDVAALYAPIKAAQEAAAGQTLIAGASIPQVALRAKGGDFAILGTGFAQGDVIELYSPKANETAAVSAVATLDGDEGAHVALPADLADGYYSVYVTRGDVRQYVGIANLQFLEKCVPGSKVIAHRGWWKYVDKETQNSRAAVRAAMEAGFYGCEIDVWITTDNVIYVNHDPSFGGVTIQTSNSSAVSALTLSNGEKMPTLEDLLKIMQEYPDSPTKLIIELKEHSVSTRMKACSQAATALVASYGLEPRVEYISFSLDACKQIRDFSPETPVAYLGGGMTPAGLAFFGINLDYHQDEFKNHPGWIEEAHDLRLTTNVWTVDNEATILDFNLAGVDFITTNVPDIAQEIKEQLDASFFDDARFSIALNPCLNVTETCASLPFTITPEADAPEADVYTINVYDKASHARVGRLETTQPTGMVELSRLPAGTKATLHVTAAATLKNGRHTRDVSAEIEVDTSGIENVSTDNTDGPTCYYSLEGIRIANPTPGSIGIVVKNNQATKVRF